MASRNPQGEQTPGAPAPRTGAIRKTLAGVIGAIGAAALLVSIPAEESGRKVEVAIAPTGEATVRHVSGPQYLRAYRDIAGIPTACDGITRGVRIGQNFTEAQCAAMLERELVVHAEGVLACTPSLRLDRPGRDYQRFAAVSLAYNIGVPAFCGSTAHRLFEAGHWSAGCDAFRLWNKSTVNGRRTVVRGLVLRRSREWEACVTNVLPGRTPANLAARVARWS